MKGVFQLIEYIGEKYITLAELARRLGVSSRTCANNVLPSLTVCYLPGRKRPVYKLVEIEQLAQVRTVKRQVQPLTLVKQNHETSYIEDNHCEEAL